MPKITEQRLNLLKSFRENYWLLFFWTRCTIWCYFCCESAVRTGGDRVLSRWSVPCWMWSRSRGQDDLSWIRSDANRSIRPIRPMHDRGIGRHWL